jgi:hypothetical protein
VQCNTLQAACIEVCDWVQATHLPLGKDTLVAVRGGDAGNELATGAVIGEFSLTRRGGTEVCYSEGFEGPNGAFVEFLRTIHTRTFSCLLTQFALSFLFF